MTAKKSATNTSIYTKGLFVKKDDYVKWYIQALKAYDDGLIRADRIDDYAQYLQDKANKENKNA